MNWTKKLLIILLLIVIGFAFAKFYIIEDAQKVQVDKNYAFPLEEIFSQYNDLQKFVRWNEDELSEKDLFINYYQPYQGVGSSMSYRNKKGDIKGELSIIEQKENYIQYQYFKGNQEPLYVKVLFSAETENSTKVTYLVEKPAKTILNKIEDYWKEEPTFFILDKQVDGLEQLLSNRIEKEKIFTNITYDSIMLDDRKEEILLGKHFSVMNSGNMFQKSVQDNIDQLQQYIRVSLNKKEDEYGFPKMIMNPNQMKNKQISYYLGIPLSSSVKLNDKLYGFRTLERSKAFSVYVKGNVPNIYNSVKPLTNKAKKDSLLYNKAEYIFLSAPKTEEEVKLKIILPVSK
ncbi:MAG: hypothetical protein CSA38_00575 [Flavobacteriales bacterium]|nr:MAG: hypothetical protein CSA38_00575 [Flavobacteriales bacterium]